MSGGEHKKRIGLFGGTFDPVHAGHLAIARQAIEAVQLDRVFFIPAADPPHKKKTGAAYGHRVAMLEAALTEEAQEQDQYVISLLEAELPSPSYTIKTLLELNNRLIGRNSLYFIIGADSLLELHLWYRYQELIRMTGFIVISRPGIPVSDMRQAIEQLPGSFLPDAARQRWIRADGAEIFLLANKLTKNISSSMIRGLLRYGKQPDTLPYQTRQYIIRHNLYQTDISL
ncbi:MAG: nicotinate (nicotinamide) nucleotide adenylyltransferase [Candidatus Electrothrix sp. AR4]|nr:nicotinate (nicotinamide) nucleotide adenylyltransferase [Candidatus Electrothrix sp. AR4]